MPVTVESDYPCMHGQTLISSISARAYIANDNTLHKRVSGDQRSSNIDFLLCNPTEDLNRRLGLMSV